MKTSMEYRNDALQHQQERIGLTPQTQSDWYYIHQLAQVELLNLVADNPELEHDIEFQDALQFFETMLPLYREQISANAKHSKKTASSYRDEALARQQERVNLNAATPADWHYIHELAQRDLIEMLHADWDLQFDPEFADALKYFRCALKIYRQQLASSDAHSYAERYNRDNCCSCTRCACGRYTYGGVCAECSADVHAGSIDPLALARAPHSSALWHLRHALHI